MKVFNGIESYDWQEPTAITTGTFDGIHIGHKTILNQLISEAKEINGRSVLVTFSPHPRLVLFPDREGPILLTTLDERLELLEKTGIDDVIVHPFTMEFSRLSALNYIRDLLVAKLHMKRLVIGYDHHFGRNREGSIDELREMSPMFGFEVTEIPPQDIDQVNISSTKIRNALYDGDIDTATVYLNYSYFINGEVVHGAKRGGKMGFPTANVKVNSPWKLIPRKGVYAVRVDVAGTRYDGMLNIGVNPTFGEQEESIEVHIFDFNEDLYGKEIRINFFKRIRDEVKFDSVDDLINRMKIDQLEVKEALKI